jgi:hypothetical protein
VHGARVAGLDERFQCFVRDSLAENPAGESAE